MKANELMIGSLVRTDKGNVICVESISTKKQHRKLGYHEPGDMSHIKYIRIDQVKPISLTEDIVRANCTEKSFHNDLYLFKQISPVYMDCLYNSCTETFHIHGVNCGLCCDGKFGYVHELQHALRLCGLNELADNFKV